MAFKGARTDKNELSVSAKTNARRYKIDNAAWIVVVWCIYLY